MVTEQEAKNIKKIVQDLHKHNIFGTATNITTELNSLLGYTAYINTKIQIRQQRYNSMVAFTVIAIAALTALIKQRDQQLIDMIKATGK